MDVGWWPGSSRKAARGNVRGNIADSLARRSDRGGEYGQLQETADPFEGARKAQQPTIRTACFPYPGTVTIDTADAPCLLGDVMLSVALWIEAEQITLDGAAKVVAAPRSSVGVGPTQLAPPDPQRIYQGC
jgi:hypothetical protein